MPISLYDATVKSFIQTVGAVHGFLEKGLGHFNETGQNPDAIVGKQLHPDMLPFRFQLISVAHHSAGAVAGAKAGAFHPPSPAGDLNYAGLQVLVRDALAALNDVTPDEINALEGKDVGFHLGPRTLPFTAEGFLLSFSLPNLHFHATTAYDILRQAGVPLGKRDYMGAMRLKT
jgi:uncharacterized protein